MAPRSRAGQLVPHRQADEGFDSPTPYNSPAHDQSPCRARRAPARYVVSRVRAVGLHDSPRRSGGRHVTAQDFGVRGDGTSDDSGGIQAAIDKATTTPNGGIVFVPSGRYRLTRTIYVWRGVRVIGYGATRPVFVLADNTPGFQKGIGLMVMFTARRPAGSPVRRRATPACRFRRPAASRRTTTIPDAGPSTFYPAMSNIDFEIGDGNPAAIAIRFHVAQHGYLSHMDFHIGSGLAALTQIGNEAEDLHFYGGRYGILTDNTSPFWQFTLLDSVFDGQRDAAIREHMAGLTLVREHVPQRARGDRHRSALFRSAVGEGQPVREHLQGGRRHQQREERRRPRWASRMPSARTCRRSRDSARAGRRNPAPDAIYRVSELQLRSRASPALGMIGQLDTLYSRRAAERAAGAAAAGDRAAAADRQLGQRPHARRQGRRTDRRHRRHPEGGRHASRAVFPERLLHRPQTRSC